MNTDFTGEGGRVANGDEDATALIDAVGAGPGPTHPTAATRRRRGLWLALGAGVVLVLGIVVAYLIDLNRTAGRIERGTTVAGVPVGGLTPAEATEVLITAVAPRFAANAEVSAHGESVTLDPVQAGLTPDIAAAVAAAGIRSSSPWDRLTSFWHSADVPVAVRVDQDQLRAWVADLAARTDVEAVEGSLVKDGVDLVAVEPVVGRHLLQDEAAATLEQAWRAGGAAALDGIDLPVSTEPVQVSVSGLATARKKAETLLAGDLTVRTANGTLTIPQRTVARAVAIEPAGAGFGVTVDSAVLRTAIEDRVDKTERPAKDAAITLTDDGPAITPGVTERTVDWDTTQGRAGRALLSERRVWTVAYTETEPEFSTADAKAYGLTEVIGEFTTSGFAYTSGQNVKVVAAKVNGALIEPGETFSLNTFTGPRTEAQGYIPAGVIQNGVISTAVGGGISQFATTLYNASYFAGMGDVTHTPHSFYISRYPLGREATVYDGQIDLAFSNDYDTAVMIQTIWTESDITVRLWGTKHVEVQSETGEPFGYTAPETRTIPYGQSCAPSSGSSGYSVVNTRIISDLDGKVIRREPFTTVYNGQVQVICQPAPAPATSVAPTSTGAPGTGG